MNEIIESTNYIIKTFEQYDISILTNEPQNKKSYYFRANDVANVLGILNIRSSIQNFTKNEKAIHQVETFGRKQDTLFLTCKGIYRLLYGGKKPLVEKFREWTGDILDDIIFETNQKLEKKLKEKNNQLRLQLKISEEKNIQLMSKITNIKEQKDDGWIY